MLLLVKKDFQAVMKRLLSRFNYPCSEEKFIKWWCYEQELNMELIEWAQNGSFSNVAIATNQEKIRSASIIQNIAGYDFYQNKYISHEIGFAKPDPRFFDHILSVHNVSADEVIFIDDTQENVESANEAGINGVRFHNNKQVMREVQLLLS